MEPDEDQPVRAPITVRNDPAISRRPSEGPSMRRHPITSVGRVRSVRAFVVANKAPAADQGAEVTLARTAPRVTCPQICGMLR